MVEPMVASRVVGRMAAGSLDYVLIGRNGRAEGILTDDEFSAKKAELLDRL